MNKTSKKHKLFKSVPELMRYFLQKWKKKKKTSWWNRVDADLRAGLQKKSGPCINGSETEATSRLSDLALCTPPLEISDTESQNTFLKLSCTLKTLN